LIRRIFTNLQLGNELIPRAITISK